MSSRAAPRSDRIELRASPDEKSTLMRAAALERLDLTSFVLGTVLPRAEQVILGAERVELSRRDARRIMDLLDDPPAPSDRLVAAARARLPKG